MDIIYKHTEDGKSLVALAEDVNLCKSCTERCYIYVTGQDYIAFTTPHQQKTKSMCCGGIAVVMVPLTSNLFFMR